MLSLFFLFILHMQVFIFHNFEYTPQLKSRHILRRARTFFRYTHDRRYSTRRCLSLIYTVFCFRLLFILMFCFLCSSLHAPRPNCVRHFFPRFLTAFRYRFVWCPLAQQHSSVLVSVRMISAPHFAQILLMPVA